MSVWNLAGASLKEKFVFPATVSEVVPWMVPEVAVTVTFPTVSPCARPPPPTAWRPGGGMRRRASGS